MTNSEITRTKDRALEILKDQLAQNPDEPGSEDPVEKLAGDILEQILEREWAHQFDEDRDATIRSIREIVELGVDEHLLRKRLS